MNYYEHFLGDYNKKTSHLRMGGHGAYRMLLDDYYAKERPLPAAYVDLYVICRALERSEQATVRAVADEFFPVGPDGLRHNERADVEIVRAQKRIAASQINGKRGGSKPRSNPTGNPLGNPAGNPAGTPEGTQQGTQPGEALPHAPHTIQKTEGETEGLILPKNLLPATWADWRAHLANKGKGMTPQQERLALVRLAEHSDPEAVVQNAIAQGHRNLEPIGGWPETKRETRSEMHAKLAAEMQRNSNPPTDGTHDEPHDITAESRRIA